MQESAQCIAKKKLSGDLIELYEFILEMKKIWVSYVLVSIKITISISYLIYCSYIHLNESILLDSIWVKAKLMNENEYNGLIDWIANEFCESVIKTFEIQILHRNSWK